MTVKPISLESILSSLNKYQLEAVKSIEGPVMVLAGPGTGKTQILASRIAYILGSTDTSPSSILALTFTESGVKAMRSRLHELLGPTGLDVTVNTFHGFAADLITSNPDYFSTLFGFKVASDLDRFLIVKNILEAQHFDFLKPPGAPLFYIKDLLSTFSALKREAVTPPVLRTLVEEELQTFEETKGELNKTKLNEVEKRIGKLGELRDFYYLYQHELSSARLYDFDDMINLVTKGLIDNPELLLTYQERYQYFHVDEFQDTNNSQLQLFTTIASYWGASANVFVVGDPNQSIFRFQGANMENIINFEKTYPTCKIITLIDNYRSTDHILNTAHLLLQQNPSTNPVLQRATQRLQKNSPHPEVVPELLSFDNSISEYLYIKDSVQKLITSGVSPKDIAIIVKTNEDAKKPKQVLDKFGITCQFAGGSNLFESESVTRLLDLLRLVENLSRGIEDTEYFTVLSSPYLDIPPTDLMKVFRYSHQHKTSLYDLIDSAEFQSLGLVSNVTRFEEFQTKINLWNQASNSLAIDLYLEKIILESGLLRYLETTQDAFFELDALRLFFDFVLNQNKKIGTIKELLIQIDLVIGQNLKFTLESLLSKNAVTITTAHKSKGLEWDYVFIPQSTDSRYGKKYDRVMIPLPVNILQNNSPEDLIGEDLRLFYVAITRARKHLILSYSQTYPDSMGKPTQSIPSRFVGLLGINETQISSVNEKDSLVKLLSPTNLPEGSSLAEALDDLVLSASDFNLYNDCGYKYLLEKIYKIPQTKNSALIFGTLIHDSLEYLYRTIKNTTKKPSLEDLLSHFEKKINLADLSASDLITRKNQGKAVLKGYYDQIKADSQILFLEKYFGGITGPILFSGTKLVGKVDQIQLLDNDAKTIRIIDYKTGSPKTKNEVLGATKNSNNHIYNQLLFYQLLLDKSTNFPYKAVDFVVEFVESPIRDTKKFISHSFTPTPEEQDNFQETLKKTIADIKSARFEKTTDLSICKLCRFKSHCYPNGLPN
jgi:DNA helicase II / ATP-dependent DNA helicase PcrA